MGALPNTLPRSPKKPVARAAKSGKLNQYGRDPMAPPERLRCSDYQAANFAPYVPLPFSFLADLPRLSSGASCTNLLLMIWAKSAGRGEAPKNPRRKADFWPDCEPGRRPRKTLPIPVSEWAELCRCSERQVEREFDGLQKRGLAAVEKPSPGVYVAELLFEKWEALPDYKAEVLEMPAADEPSVDPETVDESKPGNQRVTGKKPIRVPAGASTKPFPINCGVKTFRAKVEGPVDCEISCVIQAGECLTVLRFPDDWREKAGFLADASSGINELYGTFRHARRKTGAEIDHPRASELVKLFDPLLAKSAARLLSMETEALKAACIAVADCDHDYLVKFAVQRAESPIKKPAHVALICGEALQSWKASKALTVSDRSARAEAPKKAGFADRLKAEAARRLEKYGKI